MPNQQQPTADGTTQRLRLPSLDEHLQSDKSFLPCLARALVAIAGADKVVSLADFAALTDAARASRQPALMGVLIMHALEHGVDLERAMSELAQAHTQADDRECEAAFLLALPLLALQGHSARALAGRLANALKVAPDAAELESLPQPAAPEGLIDSIGLGGLSLAGVSLGSLSMRGVSLGSLSLGNLGAKARRLVKGKDLGDFLVDFGKSVGDPELIGLAKAYQNGDVTRQELAQRFALVVTRIEAEIAEYRENVLNPAAAQPLPEAVLRGAWALRDQTEQRLALLAARVRHERETFAEDIADLAHDAGNAIENSMTARMQTDQWKDKDVWANAAESDFGKEAERRIGRAVRRREEVLRLFKEELRLFQSDMQVAHSSILSNEHHTELARLMPKLRLGTRVVNAMDSTAKLTLKAGGLAMAGTGAAVYLVGSAVVVPLAAPVAPFLAGAMAAAGLFKWFTDSDKRKIAEIKHKRRAIEEVVRHRLTEAEASFGAQLERLEEEYRQTAAALLHPVLLDAEAAQSVQGMHQRAAAAIVEQTEATIRRLTLELEG